MTTDGEIVEQETGAELSTRGKPTDGQGTLRVWYARTSCALESMIAGRRD